MWEVREDTRALATQLSAPLILLKGRYKFIQNSKGSREHIINRQLNFFHTTAGVRPSHMLFIILEKIMRESLHDHHTSISIGGRTICNVRFADDIDLITGTNSEPPGLTNTLTHSSNTSGLDINNHQS